MPKIDLDEKQLREFLDEDTAAKIEALEKEVTSLKRKVTRLTRQRDEARSNAQTVGYQLTNLAYQLGYDPNKVGKEEWAFFRI
jgi:hypothetical protein